MKKILNAAVIQIYIIDLALIISLSRREQFPLSASLHYGLFLFLFHGIIFIRGLYNRFHDEFYDEYKKK